MRPTRRGFFGLIAGIAALPATAASALMLPGRASDFHRLSCERGDPGEIPLSTLRADGFKPRIFLNGVEEKRCITADSREGWIKRPMTTPSGKLMLSGDMSEVLEEVVHGKVDIRIEKAAPFVRGEFKGSPGMVGERGPELVIPLRDSERIGQHVLMDGRRRSFLKVAPTE